jgi:glyoxylate utilization-related uncharacterized protein
VKKIGMITGIGSFPKIFLEKAREKGIIVYPLALFDSVDEEIKKDTVLIRRNERDSIESVDSNTKISLLTSNDIDKQMEPIFYEIGPKGESGRDYFAHPGEEFVFVLQGNLEIYVNEKKYSLEEGDSLYFKSSQKHKFYNPTEKTAKVIWVVTPPTF